MNKIKDLVSGDQFKLKIYPEIKRFIAVIVFTIIYGVGVNWFLEASAFPMYTGGIPGIGQLVRDFLLYRLDLFGIANIAPGDWEGIFLGAFIIVCNIPILILGWFGVSKKFTIYSLVSILIQATILSFIPKNILGLSAPEHAVTVSILGGLLIGIGTGGALKYGTSTGGLDIVAQYVSLRNGKSVGTISTLMNVITAILGGLITSGEVNVHTGLTMIGGVIISYTVLRLIISMVVTDRIHTAYHFVSVEVVSDNPDQIISDILVKIYRGVTLINVQGGYTHKEKKMIVVVIATYELANLIPMVKHVDPNAFIIVKPVKQIYGNFKKKTIA